MDGVLERFEKIAAWKTEERAYICRTLRTFEYKSCVQKIPHHFTEEH